MEYVVLGFSFLVAAALSGLSALFALTGGYAANESGHRRLDATETWSALFALKAAVATAIASAAAWAWFGHYLGAM